MQLNEQRRDANNPLYLYVPSIIIITIIVLSLTARTVNDCTRNYTLTWITHTKSKLHNCTPLCSWALWINEINNRPGIRTYWLCWQQQLETICELQWHHRSLGIVCLQSTTWWAESRTTSKPVKNVTQSSVLSNSSSWVTNQTGKVGRYLWTNHKQNQFNVYKNKKPLLHHLQKRPSKTYQNVRRTMRYTYYSSTGYETCYKVIVPATLECSLPTRCNCTILPTITISWL